MSSENLFFEGQMTTVEECWHNTVVPGKSGKGRRAKKLLAEEIARVYRVLNNDLFSGQLPEYPVTVRPNEKYLIRWVEKLEEIKIGCDLTNATETEIKVAVLHEMVHVFNADNQRSDCTSNSYHNKKFLQPALMVGLIVIHHKTQGWGITTAQPPQEISDDIAVPEKDAIYRRQLAFERAVIDKEILKEAKEWMNSLNESKKGQKVYFMKYTCECPGPHNSIRSGRRPDGPNALNVICQNCGKPFLATRSFS